MRLWAKYPELVSVFKEASRNLKRIFYRKLIYQKNLKIIGAYSEFIDSILTEK
jgi:hypothetical protein